jgi:hypothetical protein
MYSPRKSLVTIGKKFPRPERVKVLKFLTLKYFKIINGFLCLNPLVGN